MNRYFFTNVFMVVCCAYVVYAIGSYKLFANMPELAAVGLCLGAMFAALIGIKDMYVTIREYFKAKK
tara:strand:+ start:217 stop:417 length:201 start_codon:yes stop_codon:yes gene_type:complete